MMEDPTGKGIPLGYPRRRGAGGMASLMAATLLGLSSFKGRGVPDVEVRIPDSAEAIGEYSERERRDKARFPSRKKRLRMKARIG